ncbi:type II secretion system pseudopilin OxpG [Geotalea uraniireducens]|uniref:Type II secretion system pseudopilin OxpG n=1 Tax=Geotalea uraniireducens TaxID=351604 RepID=A0ABN6VSR3_9BACT|nr:prepilin-type N-terminal cleavage/methylation domain-containing protein [Geotalea uraniireducens]BDV43351.1 type II secretion system pseudopilin OxpG [Geotalea uraniireducens]
MLLKVLKNRKGFTLIELMIVLTIIGILASIAVPNYRISLIKAREAVLKEDLHTMNSAIDQYWADQGKYPDSLQDLIDKNYLPKVLPTDPITRKNDTWLVDPPPEQSSGGESGTKDLGNVYRVRSGSDLIATDGTPYRDW